MTTGKQTRTYRRQTPYSRKPAVVLLSGGIDSTTLLFHVASLRGRQNIHAVSFIYGQRHARELLYARMQARIAGVHVHRVFTLRDLGAITQHGSALTDRSIPVPRHDRLTRQQLRQPPTYVPNRNMILLSLAAAYAESNGIADVYYGAHAQDSYGYWDCTAAFLSRLNRALALNRRTRICIHAPFIRKSKAAIVSLGRRLGVDYSRTWSCYEGGKRPCGVCPTCVERSNALRVLDTPIGARRGNLHEHFMGLRRLRRCLRT